MEKMYKDMCNLINDAYVGRVATFANDDAVKYTDEAIRQGFFEILGEEKLTWAGWRNHKNQIFTIMETVLNTNLPLAWEGSRFYDQFVETKNGALGDKNEFIVEDNSVLVAATFAGNHWDTERKKLPGNESFSLKTEWFYIHLYQDFERFLKGTITITDLVNKMQKGMLKAIDNRVYTSFNGAGTYLPAAFQVTGTYDRTKMSELIQRVEEAAQKSVVIAGTKVGLAAIAEGIDSKWISNAQKEEMATTGTLVNLTGLGVVGVEIPQVFERGTYNFKVDNKSIFVLPDNEKFIKVFFEGDTRARELGMENTHDQTIDTQIQTKVGVGVVFSNIFGKYTLV